MTKVDILQGTLDRLVLKTLSNDPMRGFAIVLRIRHLTDEVIQIGEGSFYQDGAERVDHGRMGIYGESEGEVLQTGENWAQTRRG